MNICIVVSDAEGVLVEGLLELREQWPISISQNFVPAAERKKAAMLSSKSNTRAQINAVYHYAEDKKQKVTPSYLCISDQIQKVEEEEEEEEEEEVEESPSSFSGTFSSSPIAFARIKIKVEEEDI